MVEEGKGGDRPNSLDGFLATANGFVETTFAALGSSLKKQDDRDLLEANVETLTAQFRGMTDKVLRSYTDVAVSLRSEIDDFLELQQGRMIACNTQRTAAAMIPKGVKEGFLIWLARNLQEIKKIIRMILRIIFDDVPAWYDNIALLIDELAHIILSLFASLTGLNASRLATELSKSEQNFWAEQAALDRVASMRRRRRHESDD